MNDKQTDHIVEANKMVTAVESIIQKINNVKPTEFCSIETIKKWCIEAKAMEKEQIKNGWDNGFLDYQISMHEDADQYYNETYGS